MARMSREFTLVLVGASLLTAGYFLWPEDEPARKAEQAAANGNDNRGSRTSARYHFIPIIVRGNTISSPSNTRTTVARGGFGRIGGFSMGG
jgi:hypothetical protein